MKKIIKILAVTTILASTLSGCTLIEVKKEFTPLPEEQQYQRIDNMLETLNYQNAGTIINEEKTSGGGVFGTTRKSIKYEGKDAYNYLSTNLTELFEDCRIPRGKTMTNCLYGSLSIGVIYKENITVISISDQMNGR